MPVVYKEADAIADIPAATYDVLKDRFRQLTKALDAIGVERKKIREEMRKRELEVYVKLRVGTLTEAEKLEYKAIINRRHFKGCDGEKTSEKESEGTSAGASEAGQARHQQS